MEKSEISPHDRFFLHIYNLWYLWQIWGLVLVSLVFQVFSTAELTSPCENSEFDRLSFFIDFLYDFTLFVIDMHQNMPISLFKTLFDHFHFHPPAGIIWRVILKLRLMYLTSSINKSNWHLFYKLNWQVIFFLWFLRHPTPQFMSFEEKKPIPTPKLTKWQNVRFDHHKFSEIKTWGMPAVVNDASEVASIW